MNVGRIFRRAVDRRPDAIGVVDGSSGERYSYAEWDTRARSFAGALDSIGFGEGTRVATTMRNRAELAVIYAATQLANAVFVPLNFRASADDLEYFVGNADPDVLVYGASTEDAVRNTSVDDELFLVAADSPADGATPYETLIAEGDPAFERTLAPVDQTSLILHTGGSTGRPKGVPRTHTNTYAAAVAHAIQSHWAQDETTLGLISLSHTMGIHALATSMLLNGTWVAQRRFDAARTVDLIESESITSLYLVPTVFHDLLESDVVPSRDVSTVQHVSYAGASMRPAMLHDVQRVFQPETLVNHYGSTEVYTHTVSPVTDENPGCAGRAGVNTRVRVVEPSEFGTPDPTDVVASNELGEVVVDTDSPEAFDGYLNPETTARTVVDDWFFTGDLAYRDDAGDLYVVGRVDDMINSGGENIYPVEVEAVLESHDRVVEAAVVGRSSDRWNQTVAAFVTLTDDPETDDYQEIAAALDAYCRRSDELADFKRPRQYFFIDELAKSNVGKILRKELQKTDLDIHVNAAVDV